MGANFRRVALVSVVSSALVVAAVQPALGAPPPRAVVDTAPAWTAQAPVVGDVPADQTQHLTVALHLRDEAGAEALAAAVADPGDAQYGKYVSAADWRTRFAPTDDTVSQVTTWLTAQGFSVGTSPANHRYIPFTGSTAQVQAAFGTSVKNFDRDGQPASAPATALTAPTSVAGLIAGIGGLDSSATVRPDHLTGDEAADGRSTGAGSRSAAPQSVTPPTATPDDVLPPPDAVYRNAPPCSTYYGQKKVTGVPQILPDPLTYAPCGYRPAQLRGAYGIDRFLAKGLDGRGATVAVVDAYASATIFADTQKYFARTDPSHPFRSYQFSQSLPASYNSVGDCDAAGWYGEETLDVQAVHAMAPGANVLYVGASSCYDPDLAAAINTVVDNQLAQIVTNSWGEPDSDTDAAGRMMFHQSFLQAGAEGISMLFSSGDNGDEIASTDVRQTDSPASDPAVTAVGGTSLAVGKTANYLFEQGWGTGSATLTKGVWDPNPPAYFYGAGGGTSQLFKQPAYQRGVVPADIANWVPAGTTPNGPHRAVPDVAMDADPQTGMLIGQSQTFPDGSIKYSEYRIGGTSLASPLLAGVVAVGDQATGGSLGFLNPRLYRTANASLLRDVTTACPTAPQQCVTDGVVRVNYANGFNASGGTTTVLRTFNQTGTIYTRPGYDDVTGVGSPNIGGLLGGSAGGGASSGPGGSAGPVHGQPMR